MLTRRTFAATVMGAAAGSLALVRRAPGALAGNHRVAWTADGNYYDKDDWGSSPMALRLIRDAGMVGKLVHFDYNNHIPQSSWSWEKEMAISCQGAPNGYNTRTQRQSTINHLRSVIAASSSSNLLVICLAGPPDNLYEALQGVPMITRKYVTVVSHSSKYNETTGGVHTLAQCTGVAVVKIPNQNQRLNTQQNWAPWWWLTNTHPDNQFVYDRMRKSGRADVSDSGMMYYVLYGNSTPTITDFRRKLET